ncbi:hypothetical protein M1349_05735 [Patescibacteria group bacterium]|nr:hypothetical protein [Patescibacteria group bacterium]
MFKKLAIAGASSALLLATVVPVFARGDEHHGHDDGSSVRVENRADVRNTSVAISNTGLNKIGGHEVEEDGARIRTGAATSYATVYNNVNKTKVDLCGCEDESSVRVENNADVRNTSVAISNTGLNKIGGHEVEGGRIRTGGAYADSLVDNVVNTTVVGGGSN